MLHRSFFGAWAGHGRGGRRTRASNRSGARGPGRRIAVVHRHGAGCFQRFQALLEARLGGLKLGDVVGDRRDGLAEHLAKGSNHARQVALGCGGASVCKRQRHGRTRWAPACGPLLPRGHAQAPGEASRVSTETPTEHKRGGRWGDKARRRGNVSETTRTSQKRTNIRITYGKIGLSQNGYGM